jgi:hypothetical protein
MPPQTSNHETRTFVSSLFLAFGPLFQLGGWAAAFTDIGAILVFTGTGMSLAGLALRPTVSRGLVSVLGILAGGWGWQFVLWLLL